MVSKQAGDKWTKTADGDCIWIRTIPGPEPKPFKVPPLTANVWLAARCSQWRLAFYAPRREKRKPPTSE